MPPQPQSNSGGGKKSKQPIAFDLGAMIDALEVRMVVKLNAVPWKILKIGMPEVIVLNMKNLAFTMQEYIQNM